MKKIPQTLGAICAAYALSMSAALALEVLYVGNVDSTQYAEFIEAKFPGSTWVHKPSGLIGADTIGGDLDRVTDFAVVGSHGGTGITVKAYMESFDLVIVGSSGVTSGNFVHATSAADWAALTKPVLFHHSLIARALGNRPGMFGPPGTGDNNVTLTYADPDDTVRISATPLSDAIFEGVTTPTDLYDSTISTFTETISSAGTLGGGELITSLTDGVTVTPPRGVVFWDAGVTNGSLLTLAAKRAFFPMRNNISISFTPLTADGQLVLGNLIDELLVSSAPVFLPPAGLTATSGIGSINLTWTGSAGATSYNVKRSTTAGTGHVTVSIPGSVTGNTYTDTGLINGTPYFYVVSAVDDSPVLESANSAEATATPVEFIYPGIDILFVANADSAVYRNFASNGQFAANTWTQKATGLTANETIGGDLDRTATFTGVNAGTDITVRAYMESFDLIIVSGPTTSGNLIDGSNGSDWAELTTPVIYHSNAVVRSTGGRPGLFSGDNFITSTLVSPDETVRVSTSALSDALLAGVSSVTNLYSFATADLIIGTATYGTGEAIARMTDSATNLNHFGLVFWAASDISGNGNINAANRAFLPLKGNIDDLTIDGKILLTNLINQIQDPQVTPANPYGEWAATNISALELLALPGFNQDADDDGIFNGLEWALGGNPLLGDVEMITPTSAGSAADGLTMIFPVQSEISETSSTLSVEWGSDLAALPNSVTIGSSDVAPVGSNPTVDIDAPVVGKVTVNIPAANAVGGKIFGRLRVRTLP